MQSIKLFTNSYGPQRSSFGSIANYKFDSRLDFSKRFFRASSISFAGHSKWHNIKHKKAANDVARAAQFLKVSKEITVSVKFSSADETTTDRLNLQHNLHDLQYNLHGSLDRCRVVTFVVGGKDPESNVRLMSAISKAKEIGFSRDGIENAIAKGAGELGGAMEEIVYEGYGPGGVAMIIKSLTNSKNRTNQVVRNAFQKNGGNLGSNGSVSWMFPQKGFLSFANGGKGEEELMEPVLEAGAEDMEFGKGDDGKEVQVICDPRKLIAVKRAVESKGLTVSTAEIILVPTSTVTELSQEDNESLQKIIDILEDNEDIQTVNHNFSPTDQNATQ